MMADTDLPAWCTVGARVAMHYHATGGGRTDRIRYGTVVRYTATQIVVACLEGEARFMRSTLRRREPTTAWDGWTTLADPESRDVKRARRDQMLSDIVYGVRSAVNDATFRDSKDFNAVQQTIMTLSRACETALRQLENLGSDDEAQ